MHCVDVGESFQTNIFLQNLASIQPRTGPVKFARSAAASVQVRDRLAPREVLLAEGAPAGAVVCILAGTVLLFDRSGRCVGS